jgi:serine protease Do
MKNVKFGAFCLGLIVVIGTAISSVSAQARVQARPEVRLFDGRGLQLGVMVSDVDAKSATGGVKIDEVHAASPAEKAGIRSGDIVVDYDGEKVRSARQFTRLVQETPEGRTVAIGLMRDGKKQTVNATPEAGRMTWDFRREPGAGNREPGFHLRELPDFNFDFHDFPRRFEYRMPDGVFRFPDPGSRIPGSRRGRLGVTVQPLTPELEEYFGVKNGGALVSSVSPDSAAAKAGVKAGDVIVSINGNAVRDSNDLSERLEGIGADATIVVMRDKKELTLKATLDDRPSRNRAIRPSRPGLIL